MAAEGCINENSTYIRKQMGEERDRDREGRERTETEREGGKDTVYPRMDQLPPLPCYWPFSNKAEKPTNESFSVLTFGTHTSLYKSYLGPTATQAEDQVIWHCSPYLARYIS